MHSYLNKDLAYERQRRFLSDAERIRLANQAATTGQRMPVVVRALGAVLIALGSRLGGGIQMPPAPAEPTLPAAESQIAAAP